jgi:hypothetical protein
MFATELTQIGHTKRFIVRDAGPEGGWEVRIEQDSALIRRVCYKDWHRVERALMTISEQVSELKAKGWREKANKSG